MTRINTNVSSLVAQKTLSRSNTDLQTALTRLSTGLRINSGKDDPAGLIASEVLRSDIVSVEKAITNSERANQLIGTADSAISQVSALLNDIRGLVSESANSGALSEEQIAANQLQIDSSLESIDRIARVTSFQGRRLLDGSLDFLTTNPGSLSQGARTTVGTLSGAAAAGTIGNTAGVIASGTAGNAAATYATDTLAGVGVDLQITALAGASQSGLAGTGVTVSFLSAGLTQGNETVTFTGGSLQFSVESGVSTAADLVNALSASTGLANTNFGASIASGVGGGTVVGGANQLTLAGGEDQNAFTLVAQNAALEYNVTVSFTSAGLTAGNETATYNSGASTLVISLDSGSSTLTQVLSAINAQVGTEFSAVAANAGTSGALFTQSTTGGTTTGGVDENAFTLSAVNIGSEYNVAVSFTSAGLTAGSETVTYNSGAGTLTLSIESGVSSTTQLISAINAQAGTEFTAALNSAGTGAGVFVASQTGSTTGGSNENQISVQAISAGATYNATTLLFTSGATAGSEIVSYDTAANTLSIQIATGASTVAQVLSAVNANASFSAAATSGVSAAGVFTSTLASTFSGGGTQSQLSDLRIDQANFGTASQIAVNVFIDQQATKAALNYNGGTLSNELVLEIGGRDGFEAFNFGATTTTAQIADAINLVTDATGVTATVAGGTLSLESRDYGLDSFVSVRALNSNDGGSFATTDAGGATAERVNGTDVQARINGVSANGKGLVASLNTSTLDLSFSVSELLADGSNVSFNITGGGAVFQLGPDVVSNQQARLGIQNLNTARLGGVSGSLFELRSGKAKSVANDAVGAASVVDEVISQVTQLRGRLGAFQKTSLETNIFTLNDTLEALTEAESSIRDADFARESAQLVRAQILVQSGTAVLGIANQNPQNVLSLLR